MELDRLNPNGTSESAYQPAVETIIHNAGIEVKKVPISPDEVITLVRIHTPLMVYTVKLDDDGVEFLINALRRQASTPDIVIAQPKDVPGLTR